MCPEGPLQGTARELARHIRELAHDARKFARGARELASRSGKEGGLAPRSGAGVRRDLVPSPVRPRPAGQRTPVSGQIAGVTGQLAGVTSQVAGVTGQLGCTSHECRIAFQQTCRSVLDGRSCFA